MPPEPWINFLMLDSQRDRVIVVAGTDLALVDARTGALVRDVRLASSVAPLAPSAGPIALDERAGRLYVTQIGPMLPQATLMLPANPAGTGTVRVLDVHTGALIKTVTVGLTPDLVAIDEQTGRAFVVNAGCPDPDHRCGPTRSTPWGWLPSGLRRWLPWLSPPAHVETGGTVSVVNTAQ